MTDGLRKNKKKLQELQDKYKLDLPEKLLMVRRSLQAVVQGYKTSRLITGTPGIGKTWTVEDELKISNVPYHYVSGGIDDARALYQYLYDHNGKDSLIVFDDVNQILRQRKSVEILRAALTNFPVRKITFADNVTTKKGNKFYKPSMDFESKIIFITNIPKAKIDKAILSRTSPIELIASLPEIATYIYDNIEAAPPHEVPLEWKYEVFDFIIEEIGLEHVNQFDFRIFEDAVIWKAASKGTKDMNEDDWKECVYTLVIGD